MVFDVFVCFRVFVVLIWLKLGCLDVYWWVLRWVLWCVYCDCAVFNLLVMVLITWFKFVWTNTFVRFWCFGLVCVIALIFWLGVICAFGWRRCCGVCLLLLWTCLLGGLLGYWLFVCLVWGFAALVCWLFDVCLFAFCLWLLLVVCGAFVV